MRVIARCNATVLTEAGERIGVVQVGGGWLGTALFVTVLLTVMPVVNGGVMLVLGAWIPGVVLIGVAAVAAVLAMGIARRRRAAKARPPGTPWLTFDLAARVVRDERGAELAPLAQVALRRTWQAGSSSKALALQLPGQTIVIARGTPFGDSVDLVEHALRARGLTG